MAIRTIAVIGTGLIGTSIALAASRRGVTVFLSDQDPMAARTAAALGAGRAGSPAGPVDLAVLAVPPSHVGTVLAELQGCEFAHSYTDAASVKSGPETEALRHAPHPSRYVGGHPLAGRERRGPLAARADLFQGRSWVLTPSPVTSSAALDRARELVALCGANPVVTQSRAHDEAVALTSHVPHLVASLMAARLQEGPDGMSRFAGQGLRDVTRIAGGASGLWGDILQANAASVVGVMKDLHADLSRLVSALDVLAEPDAGERTPAMRTLVDLLDRGIAGLAELPAVRLDASAEDLQVRVAVTNRPGELSRLLDAVTGFGVTAEDATVEDAAASWGDGLTVRFGTSPYVADRMVAELVAQGWDAVGQKGAQADWREEGPAFPAIRT
ncbi:prephenate dehydrogenase [Streptomyces sp. ISL-98]|uniref:prephenate dehydrogenase n=1 Tax=Streptomyces sp. ISL-98 TaxID=2819192 RepID=UPI001BECBD12|nr:prephenate dehydrogenase [Streptomyces sp. ISL-98]MBT2505652.1 prephenate dehydrogenase [Streptomyces sp. ISL-98]